MKAKIKVTLKNGVLDPQGKAIEGALGHLGFGGEERIIQRGLDERAALDQHHGDLALGGFQHHAAIARGTGGIIEGPQQSRFSGEIIDDFRLIPHMVAGGNDRGTGPQQVDGDPRGNAPPACGILAVDDDEIQAFALFKQWQLLDDRLAARLADDITQEQYADR